MPSASRKIDKKQLTKNNWKLLRQLSTVSCQLLKPGFTLIEFLVVIGLLALVVGSSLLFLTSILKGSNQANVTAEVKQNGQVVLDSLERQIRNATDAQKIATNTVKLIRQGQDPLYIKCIPSMGSSSNGWIGTVVSTTNPASDAVYMSITNRDDLIAGVDVQCNLAPPYSFDVIPSSSGTASPPIVLVSFVVNQGVQAPSREDFFANVEFRTTISLRKY